METGGAAIQYPPELEATARTMLPVVAEAPSPEEVLNGLIDRKGEVLQFIAEQLGRERPTRAMREVFDAVASHEAEKLSIQPDLKHLRLYPVDALDAAIASNRIVPGFVRAPDGKTLVYETGDIVYHAATKTIRTSAITAVHVESKTVTSTTTARASGKPFFPMIVFDTSGESASESSRLDTDTLQRNLRGNAVYSSATLLHETAEIVLIAGGPRGTSLLRPLDRWFSEGASDTVAALALDRFVAEGMGRTSLEDTTAYSKTVQVSINLARWPFPGWTPVPSTADLSTEELEFAYYGVAAESVEGLLECCGPDVLSDVAGCLRKTRPKPTLADAFKAVTGKSPEELFPTVYDADPQCVAVGRIEVGAAVPLLWHVNHSIRPTKALSLDQALSGRLAVYCEAAALQLPAQVELRLFDPTGVLLDARVTELNLPWGPVGVRFQPDPPKLKRGRHTIEISVNGVLCKGIPIDIN